MGSRPQQPEIARTERSPLDRESRDMNARETLPEGEDRLGPVPEANRPGHRPEHDQDKPEGPPA